MCAQERQNMPRHCGGDEFEGYQVPTTKPLVGSFASAKLFGARSGVPPLRSRRILPRSVPLWSMRPRNSSNARLSSEVSTSRAIHPSYEPLFLKASTPLFCASYQAKAILSGLGEGRIGLAWALRLSSFQVYFSENLVVHSGDR